MSGESESKGQEDDTTPEGTTSKVGEDSSGINGTNDEKQSHNDDELPVEGDKPVEGDGKTAEVSPTNVGAKDPGDGSGDQAAEEEDETLVDEDTAK